MIRAIFIFAYVVFLGGCGSGDTIPSLVKVIDNPKAFDNQYVSVHGYLGGINLALYITKDHELMGDHSSSISVVNLSYKGSSISEYCSYKYAIVEGIVKKKKTAPIFNINQVGFYQIQDLRRIMVFNGGNLVQCWPEM